MNPGTTLEKRKPVKRTRLHINPLRPSASMSMSIQRQFVDPLPPPKVDAKRSPFAYLQEPFTADPKLDQETGSDATEIEAEDFGAYDPVSQTWRFPENTPRMGVWTKSTINTSCSTPPTASWQGETPDWNTDDNWGIDDACQ